MAEYTLKYTGSQIDNLLDKVGDLENYDDAEVKAAIQELEDDISEISSMTNAEIDAIIAN